MNVKLNIKTLSKVAIVLLLGFSATAIAQSDCVVQGGLAWDNWTKTDAGGSELPAGVTNKDYIRCKACHGWDRLGKDGGYARRSRTDSRPNAGAGDGYQANRNISSFMGGHELATADAIKRTGIGRSYADGTGSWEDLDDSESAANITSHFAGYTMGNQMPDFSANGVNSEDVLPTQEQIDCLVEFLNYEDGDPAAYFAAINTERNPVLYTMHADADAAAGESFYNQSCFGCHGDPAVDYVGANNGHPDGGILAYLAKDGKFSEFSHKARWGMPNTIMSRAVMQSPSKENIRDMMLYLQDIGGTGFTMTNVINSHWWDAARSGEGFQLEVITNSSDELVLVAFFYTYDSMGNQVYMVAQGFVNGNSAEVVIGITAGGVFGEDFDPDLVVRTDWGTGTFTVNDCGSIQVSLVPNAEAVTNGYTNVTIDLTRLLPSDQACP
ncbi:hypothetical protein MNBD_GAMMA01-2309 [hydrothermal vent metagenome]|uniref:Cytochrome c domain-containing protein n=1 Tax=hydrothermal vent metagenome TaxID=652676 RepID=A0A3B0VFL3_9ZZZZ